MVIGEQKGRKGSNKMLKGLGTAVLLTGTKISLRNSEGEWPLSYTQSP